MEGWIEGLILKLSNDRLLYYKYVNASSLNNIGTGNWFHVLCQSLEQISTSSKPFSKVLNINIDRISFSHIYFSIHSWLSKENTLLLKIVSVISNAVFHLIKDQTLVQSLLLGRAWKRKVLASFKGKIIIQILL